MKPKLEWQANADAGDGDLICECCNEAVDEDHTWEACARASAKSVCHLTDLSVTLTMSLDATQAALLDMIKAADVLHKQKHIIQPFLAVMIKHATTIHNVRGETIHDWLIRQQNLAVSLVTQGVLPEVTDEQS